MVWFLIGLVVVVIVLTLIFTSSIEEIWLLVCAGFVMVGMVLLSIGLPIYSEKAQTVKESTEVYEVCRYSDNEYFQANTAGNSITIRVKTNNGVKEKTFNRKIVTFVDANSSTATVNYKKKEKFTSGEKFWFGLEDGKDAGKKYRKSSADGKTHSICKCHTFVWRKWCWKNGIFQVCGL